MFWSFNALCLLKNFIICVWGVREAGMCCPRVTFGLLPLWALGTQLRASGLAWQVLLPEPLDPAHIFFSL